jgi:flagellar motility protein MotE (MotC chaperone)
MPDTVLIPVAQTMKSDVLAPILAQMNPDTAQKLTVKLANRLTLPQTADAPAPVQTAQAAPAAAPATAAPAPAPAVAAPAAPAPKAGG